jgi:hypothetical protein
MEKMKTFQVNYSRNGILVLILLIIPLFIMTPIFIGIAMIWGGSLSDVALIAVVVAVMIAGILLTVWMVKRYATVPCEVSVSDSGIQVKLLRHSFLYGVSQYESEWGNIRNVSTNFDPQNSRRFYLVSFKKPNKTINLSPKEKVEAAEETELGTALLSYVDKFNNQAAPAVQIHSRGFYDSTWAKTLTIIIWIGTVAVVVLSILEPDKIPLWRAGIFLAYSAIWLTAFYINRKKK